MSSGVKLNVEAVISAVLRVPVPVYEACKTEVDDLIHDQLRVMLVDVIAKTPEKGNIVILNIKATDTQDLVKARTFLSEVIYAMFMYCQYFISLRSS